MTVESSARITGDVMARRRLVSRQAADQTVAKMKARQSAKIRDIAKALRASGFDTVDAQARILGVGRSTGWTILKSSHKGSGLSAKIVIRILSTRALPPLVRKTVLEYVEEKASGHYGHSAKLRQKFITALSANPTAQLAEARNAKDQPASDARSGHVVVASLAREHRTVQTPDAVDTGRKSPRLRGAR